MRSTAETEHRPARNSLSQFGKPRMPTKQSPHPQQPYRISLFLPFSVCLFLSIGCIYVASVRMPYQAAKEKNSKHVSTESLDQQVETDEQAAENTVHGADLLLSLTKGSTGSTNAMVTPKDPTSNNTSTGSLESSTTSCGSGMGPPVTTAEIYQRNNHFPRMLYHSPIKISTSATTTSNELSRSNKADGVSGELAPYTMVPAWSPSLYNGMMYPTAYGRSPIYNHHPHSSSIEPDENKNGKRSANKIEEKKETEDGTVCARKQRLISPSSSNEKPEEESPPDSLSSEKKKKTSWNLHAPQRPRMYNMPPHWSHQLPYPPPPHMVYPHPPPHYQMYAPYPPPWAMYAPPPPHPSNNILPPPVRRHPSPPRASTTTDSALTHDTNARHVSNESIPNDSDDRESPCPSRDESLNRCIPLKHPIPKRSWSYVCHTLFIDLRLYAIEC